MEENHLSLTPSNFGSLPSELVAKVVALVPPEDQHSLFNAPRRGKGKVLKEILQESAKERERYIAEGYGTIGSKRMEAAARAHRFTLRVMVPSFGLIAEALLVLAIGTAVSCGLFIPGAVQHRIDFAALVSSATLVPLFFAALGLGIYAIHSLWSYRAKELLPERALRPEYKIRQRAVQLLLLHQVTKAHKEKGAPPDEALSMLSRGGLLPKELSLDLHGEKRWKARRGLHNNLLQAWQTFSKDELLEIGRHSLLPRDLLEEILYTHSLYEKPPEEKEIPSPSEGGPKAAPLSTQLSNAFRTGNWGDIVADDITKEARRGTLSSWDIDHACRKTRNNYKINEIPDGVWKGWNDLLKILGNDRHPDWKTLSPDAPRLAFLYGLIEDADVKRAEQLMKKSGQKIKITPDRLFEIKTKLDRGVWEGGSVSSILELRKYGLISVKAAAKAIRSCQKKEPDERKRIPRGVLNIWQNLELIENLPNDGYWKTVKLQEVVALWRHGLWTRNQLNRSLANHIYLKPDVAKAQSITKEDVLDFNEIMKHIGHNAKVLSAIRVVDLFRKGLLTADEALSGLQLAKTLPEHFVETPPLLIESISKEDLVDFYKIITHMHLDQGEELSANRVIDLSRKGLLSAEEAQYGLGLVKTLPKYVVGIAPLLMKKWQDPSADVKLDLSAIVSAMSEKSIKELGRLGLLNGCELKAALSGKCAIPSHVFENLDLLRGSLKELYEANLSYQAFVEVVRYGLMAVSERDRIRRSLDAYSMQRLNAG